MKSHVIKYEQGSRGKTVLWCGINHKGEWAFRGAGHVVLAVGGSVAPCKNCIKAIIKELENEL